MSTTSPRPGSVTGAGRAPGAGVARIEEREITLHAQHITYRESGADSGGPVVVLLHGLAGSSSTWLPVMSLLGAHAHVIAPDLLGHGSSTDGLFPTATDHPDRSSLGDLGPEQRRRGMLAGWIR